jgi:hypothetical protein
VLKFLSENQQVTEVDEDERNGKKREFMRCSNV